MQQNRSVNPQGWVLRQRGFVARLACSTGAAWLRLAPARPV